MPHFLKFGSAEDEETTAQLSRLNRLAREKGWHHALHTVYSHNPSLVRYVTDPARAGFVELLPLTPQSDVLELGAGLGQFTVALARRAKSVCAIEVVSGQAEFAAERCRQEGAINAYLAAGGDDCRLPYADGIFDVVVVNLVLEWCAMRCLDEEQIDVQRRFLNEISRVLKPEGALYLATKNRFALRYLIGKSDEHCYGLHFGSALPRWLSRFLLRMKGHSRPFGLLHSHKGLERLLRDVGFSTVTSFWATPEMRYPTEYVLTEAESIRKARRKPGFVQGEGRSTRLIMKWVPASLVKYVTPGLAFLATLKSGTETA